MQVSRPATLLKRNSNTIFLQHHFLKNNCKWLPLKRVLRFTYYYFHCCFLMTRPSIFINCSNHPPETYFIITFDEESWKPKEIVFHMSEMQFSEAVAWRFSLKNLFLKILQNAQENTCAKKRLWHWCFPVSFVKILRTTQSPVTASEFLMIFKLIHVVFQLLSLYA